MRSQQHDDTSPVWLITGANTGFGAALTREALSRGARVVATARNPEQIDAPDDAAVVLRSRVDVTDSSSVTSTVSTALQRFGRIDVLCNNAGHGLVGAFEELNDTQVRQVLEVNLFGAMAVTRAVLPAMRKQRSGVIVQMSSVGGVVGNPGHSVYASSKFALEGWSEAIAGELAPLGVRVLLVEPGPFRTEFAGRSMTFAEPLEDYAATPAGELRRRFRDQDGHQPGDPARAARIIVDAAGDPNAPLRLPLGPDALRRIRSKLRTQLDDLETWAPTGADTTYASTVTE